MKDDQNWRYVFVVPMILEAYTVISLLLFIKNESIIRLLQNEAIDSEILIKQLKNVYSVPSEMTYVQLAQKLKSEMKFSDPVPCTIFQGFSKR